MLRLSRIRVDSVEISMAGFQLREKTADAFREDVLVRGSQGGGSLVDFSAPFTIIHFTDIEMVLEN